MIHHQITFFCPEVASRRAAQNCYFGAPHCLAPQGCGLKGGWRRLRDQLRRMDKVVRAPLMTELVTIDRLTGLVDPKFYAQASVP